MKNLSKCLAIVVAFGLFGGSVRGDQPKTYRINLTTAYKIGTVEFQPGEYKLLVDSPKVVFTELKSEKVIEVAAKIEDVGTKFEHTAIHSKPGDGVNLITEIQIKGSKTKIAFE